MDTIPRDKSKLEDKTPKIDQASLTKNIEIINKLISNSQAIVKQQDNILDKYSEISKKLNSDPNKPLSVEENNEFFEFLEKYSVNMNNILSKLKNNLKNLIKSKVKYY